MNALKIRKRKEYALVFTNGKKINGKNLSLDWLKINKDISYLLILSSRDDFETGQFIEENKNYKSVNQKFL